MKKIFALTLLSLMSLCTVAQTVSFIGRNADGSYVRLDHVVVTNHTKGWQGTLLWPDTVLNLENVASIARFAEKSGVVLSPNTPNPFYASTEVSLTVAEAGMVTLVVSDMNGYSQAVTESYLEQGTHRFRISLAKEGMYLLAALKDGEGVSVTMMCNGGGSANGIDYQWEEQRDESEQDLLGLGDYMEYVGYATVDGLEMQTEYVAQTLGTSQTVTLRLSEMDGEEETASFTNIETGDFRVALSLSPFSLNQFEQGYTFVVGDKTASTPEELQQIYRDLGSTEMYVRLATKRHKTYKADGTLDNTTDGEADENANVHTFDQVMQTCRIAAQLDIPINPEVMCAYIYMDMDGTQAPRFYEEDYPELYAKQEFYDIMHNRKWEELSLDEICTVLEIYGEFVADSILATGCTVNDWNLGNEANFGFAGIGIGTPNSFDRKLAKAGQMKRYMSSLFGLGWLKRHVWKYEAQTLAAVKRGILNAYKHYPELDASKVKFSTHIATVTSTPRATASFFAYMAEHGYAVETAGISYYPSAPAMSLNKKKMLTKTVTRINKKCGVPVFIGEFSYPSQKMVGPFAGWNKQLKGYPKDQQGQAEIYKDIIDWGKENGLIGIRYWAPDYEGEWYPMSMFEFKDKVGTAKTILMNHKTIVEQ